MKNRISEIIDSRRLSLTKKQFVLHYFFVLAFPVLVILLTQFYILYNGFKKEDVKTLQTATIKFAAYSSLAIAIIQYTKLKMTEKLCDLSNAQFHQTCVQLAEQMHWIIEAKGENFVICTTAPSWYNWGTLITIVQNNDVVMFNSVCDLHNRPASSSYGQNARNYKALHDAFLEQVPDINHS